MDYCNSIPYGVIDNVLPLQSMQNAAGRLIIDYEDESASHITPTRTPSD